MPCRNPLSAAATLKHIFITDDVLAEAFHRFARVSHAHRRHGSNVPGPLEARRRLAKRKMGMQAVTGGSAPPGGEFGALFGLGAGPSTRPDFERGWRWEGPTMLPLGRPNVGERLPWAGLGSDGLPLEPLEVEETEAEERLADFLTVPPDPVETSNAAFEALLHPLEKQTQLKEKDMEPILSFLNSTAADIDAQLTLQLFEWLATRTMPLDSWKHLGRIMKLKCLAADISTEELIAIFKLILQRKDRNLIIPIIACRVTASAIEVFPALTQHIIESAANPEERRANVLDWLACLRSSVASVRWRRADTDWWRGVYDILAQHFQPSDLEEHFGVLLRDQFALVLLRHWLPRYVAAAQSRSDEPSSAAEEPTTIDRIEFKQIAFTSHSTGPVDVVALEKSFRAKQRAVKNEKGAQKTALIDLISLLAHKRLPYTALLTEIFTIYTHTQPPRTTKNLFMDLRSRTNCGIPTPVAAKLIHHFLATEDYHFAYYVFKSVPSVPLLECFDLPIKLIQAGHTHSSEIFSFLTRRQTPSDIPPSPHRGLHKLKQPHIDLIHASAYAFASSPHLSPRTAFRRVWECYRFLLSRRAPLTPLLSRAMVKAGISRPLREEGKLAATQVRLVIGLVERVEGREKAGEVDRLVFEFWSRSFGERVGMRGGRKWGATGGEGERLHGGRRGLGGKGGWRVCKAPGDGGSSVAGEGGGGGFRGAVQLAERTSDERDQTVIKAGLERDLAEVGTSSALTAEALQSPARISTYAPSSPQEAAQSHRGSGSGDTDFAHDRLEMQTASLPSHPQGIVMQACNFDQAERYDAAAGEKGTTYQPFTSVAELSDAADTEFTPLDRTMATNAANDVEELSETVPSEDVDEFIDALNRTRFHAIEEPPVTNNTEEPKSKTSENAKADDTERGILAAMHQLTSTKSVSVDQSTTTHLNHILWKSLDLDDPVVRPSSVRDNFTDMGVHSREGPLQERKVRERHAWKRLTLPSVGFETVRLRGREMRAIRARVKGEILGSDESGGMGGTTTTIRSFRPSDPRSLVEVRTKHLVQKRLDLTGL